MRIPDYTVSEFKGLNTFVKDVKSLKPGIATDAVNWITGKYGDHIELRRGRALLGKTRVDGLGKITGLGVGLRYDGVAIPFFSHGKKVRYYDPASDDTYEVGTGLLGVSADGEDAWFSAYQNLGGSMMYFGSPHSGTFKAPIATPANAVSQYATDYRFGFLRFGQGRAFAGQRYGVNASSSDKTGLYLSKIDKPLLSDYPGSLSTQYSSSIAGNTNGVSATYSDTFAPSSGVIRPGSMKTSDNANWESFTDNGNGTLTGSHGGTGTINYVTGALSITYYAPPPAGKTILVQWNQALYAGAPGSTTYSGTIPLTGAQTAMYVSAHEAGGETLTDDRLGHLIGSQGSTGTINYATGAYSITFNHTTTGLVSVDYYLEDATNGGALDFSTADTNSTAEILRQDDGGQFMAVFPFMDVNYALHLLKTWAVTLSTDDSQDKNLPYRAIGIPYPRAACETPDGLLLIDTSNRSEPKVRRLEIGAATDNFTIVPTSLSDALDLSIHAFDYAVAYRWGDYEIICCQEYVNGVANAYNTVMYVRNVFSKAWDKLDYGATSLGDFNGALIAGDPTSNNVFELFSGFDDDDSAIANYWHDGQLNLGTDNTKVTHYMRVTGLIQKDQQIQVSVALDGGQAVVKFIIDGDGDYVDQGINTAIGSYTLGSKVSGGGGEATAHPFDVTFPIHTDRYQHISARFEALAIGHAAINGYTYKDNRDKGHRSSTVF